MLGSNQFSFSQPQGGHNRGRSDSRSRTFVLSAPAASVAFDVSCNYVSADAIGLISSPDEFSDEPPDRSSISCGNALIQSSPQSFQSIRVPSSKQSTNSSSKIKSVNILRAASKVVVTQVSSQQIQTPYANVYAEQNSQIKGNALTQAPQSNNIQFQGISQQLQEQSPAFVDVPLAKQRPAGRQPAIVVSHAPAQFLSQVNMGQAKKPQSSPSPFLPNKEQPLNSEYMQSSSLNRFPHQGFDVSVLQPTAIAAPISGSRLSDPELRGQAAARQGPGSINSWKSRGQVLSGSVSSAPKITIAGRKKIMQNMPLYGLGTGAVNGSYLGTSTNACTYVVPGSVACNRQSTSSIVTEDSLLQGGPLHGVPIENPSFDSSNIVLPSQLQSQGEKALALALASSQPITLTLSAGSTPKRSTVAYRRRQFSDDLIYQNRFKCMLASPTTPAAHLYEDPLTYLNLDQPYELRLERIPNTNAPIPSIPVPAGSCSLSANLSALNAPLLQANSTTPATTTITNEFSHYKTVVRLSFYDRDMRVREEELIEKWIAAHPSLCMLTLDCASLEYGHHYRQTDTNSFEVVWSSPQVSESSKKHAPRANSSKLRLLEPVDLSPVHDPLNGNASGSGYGPAQGVNLTEGQGLVLGPGAEATLAGLQSNKFLAMPCGQLRSATGNALVQGPFLKLALRFLVTSTDFANSKGEKGVPFRLQLDTYAVKAKAAQNPSAISTAIEIGSELEWIHLYSAATQIKVFKSRGADRKHKQDLERYFTMGAQEKKYYREPLATTPFFDVPLDNQAGLTSEADALDTHVVTILTQMSCNAATNAVHAMPPPSASVQVKSQAIIGELDSKQGQAQVQSLAQTQAQIDVPVMQQQQQQQKRVANILVPASIPIHTQNLLNSSSLGIARPRAIHAKAPASVRLNNGFHVQGASLAQDANNSTIFQAPITAGNAGNLRSNPSRTLANCSNVFARTTVARSSAFAVPLTAGKTARANRGRPPNATRVIARAARPSAQGQAQGLFAKGAPVVNKECQTIDPSQLFAPCPPQAHGKEATHAVNTFESIGAPNKDSAQSENLCNSSNLFSRKSMGCQGQNQQFFSSHASSFASAKNCVNVELEPNNGFDLTVQATGSSTQDALNWTTSTEAPENFYQSVPWQSSSIQTEAPYQPVNTDNEFNEYNALISGNLQSNSSAEQDPMNAVFNQCFFDGIADVLDPQTIDTSGEGQEGVFNLEGLLDMGLLDEIDLALNDPQADTETSGAYGPPIQMVDIPSELTQYESSEFLPNASTFENMAAQSFNSIETHSPSLNSLNGELLVNADMPANSTTGEADQARSSTCSSGFHSGSDSEGSSSGSQQCSPHLNDGVHMNKFLLTSEHAFNQHSQCGEFSTAGSLSNSNSGSDSQVNTLGIDTEWNMSSKILPGQLRSEWHLSGQSLGSECMSTWSNVHITQNEENQSQLAPLFELLAPSTCNLTLGSQTTNEMTPEQFFVAQPHLPPIYLYHSAGEPP